jgi:aspartyl-tRNA(Asn)/glutamyl-tRNA(Gln) amidotransferase subunit C
MEVTDELIENLAHLSRLRFNELEKSEIKHDLQRMIAFVEQLRDVDTSGVEPLQHLTDEMDMYREDRVGGSLDHQQALANAPATEGPYFLVPKVIKK